MIRNPNINKVLWRLTAVLSLIAALVGVLNPGIYSKVVSTDLMPAVFGQDLMTIVASVIILLLTIRIKKEDSKKQIVILGILGYLFYAYGIYVIGHRLSPPFTPKTLSVNMGIQCLTRINIYESLER